MFEVDLVSRGVLAIRCMTSMMNASLDGRPYFSLDYHFKPAMAQHTPWDWGDGMGRYGDALALMRIMTGSSENRDVEERLWKLFRGSLKTKGLSWMPPGPCNGVGRPMAEMGWCQRGPLLAFITQHLITAAPEWQARINAIIDSLLEIGRGDDDFIYYPSRFYLEDGSWLDEPERTDPTLPPWASLAQGSECWNGVNANPGTLWYRLSGYEPAARLARRTINFIRNKTRVFEPDGSFEAGVEETTHFHSRSQVALAAMRLGLAVNDAGLVDWAMGIYRSALRMGSDFGFFPERINTMRHCETCCITDMLEMAILLARYRDPRYWADAERFGKNQLLANQYVDVDWLARVPNRDAKKPAPNSYCARGDELMKTRIGGFAISARVNDLVDVEKVEYHTIGNCCHGAGARALYDLWHYAVEELPAEVRVHMHFSRKAPSLEMRCIEGPQGRIEIMAKAAKRISVRIPEFCKAAGIRGFINGKPAQLREANGYLWWETPKPGEKLALHYANRPRTTDLTLLRDNFRVAWLGNRVVAIDPPGRLRPLYQGMVALPDAHRYVQPHGHPMEREIETV